MKINGCTHGCEPCKRIFGVSHGGEKRCCGGCGVSLKGYYLSTL